MIITVYTLFFYLIFHINCAVIEVNTKLGKIIGNDFTHKGYNLSTFLGIPYAQPPLKDLRFKLPVPIKSWNEPLIADTVPNRCYQLDSLNGSDISEDCLYLNIFAPKLKFNTPKPVMIWFHGGRFVSGAATELLTIPNHECLKDTVIVSVNYRLGTFGFLYSKNKYDDAPGNVGLYDQLLAMKWVNDHIREFGGDPKRITLYGTRAGSISVSLHILSPLSRNLFKNAILIGETALNQRVGLNTSVASNAWAKGARIVGCGGKSDSSYLNISCLRNLDAAKLVKIPFLNDIREKNQIIGIFPLVLYGNNFMPKSPIQMLKNGNYKKDVSLLLGNAENEGSAFAINFDQKFFNSTNRITDRDAYNELRKILYNLQLPYPINPNDVANVYFRGIRQNDSNGFRRALSNVIGDYFLLCPNILFSKLVFSNDKKHNIKVYDYYFTQKSSPLLKTLFQLPQWVNIPDEADVDFYFGDPLVFQSFFSVNERKLSSSMINDLSNFVRFGNLPPQNGHKWQSYFYSRNGKIVAPYYEYNTVVNGNSNFGNNIKYTECDMLWKRYIESQSYGTRGKGDDDCRDDD